MAESVLYMSMSVDGFVSGPNVRRDNGIGDGGERLHEWVFPHTAGGDLEGTALTGVNKQIFDEMMSTGAVIAGANTFEGAGGWGGDHHDGVEIYIFSRHEPPDWVKTWTNVHYVDDLSLAVQEAKAAAGDRNVMVHGASVIVPFALKAGLLDELMIHEVPVLIGEGLRLFDGLGFGLRELELVRVLNGDGVIHKHYRVRKG